MDHELEFTKANRLKMVSAAYSSLVCSQGIEVSGTWRSGSASAGWPLRCAAGCC